MGRPADFQRAGGLAHLILQRHLPADGRCGTDGKDFATRHSGAGAKLDDAIRNRHRLRVVLHHEHGVSLIAQLQEQLVHPRDVMRV